MSLASRPARVTFEPAAIPAAPSRPGRPGRAGPAPGPSLLGMGLAGRLAISGAALACLWSAVALASW